MRTEANPIIATVCFLCALNAFLWYAILFPGFSPNTELYFFDVGQGDSHLLMLPQHGKKQVKVLIDGGVDAKVLGEIEEAVSPTDRYIDVVMLSHPQLDHFGGLIEVVKRYEIGIFVFNGREGTAEAWSDLVKVLREKNIPMIALGEGDKISFGAHVLSFLSPSIEFSKSKELNDSSLVTLLSSHNIRALFTGDIGKKVEEYLVKKHAVRADILKVGHHGSKFSSITPFLREVSPDIAVIQVGKNRYGHPTKEAIARLTSAGAKVYRNDANGTVKLIFADGYVNVEREK